MTVLRSLFSYLQSYGYTGPNPAHSDFVEAPPVQCDGKTVGLSPQHCRRLLDAPRTDAPVGSRDRAILAVLAYSARRVGELVRLRVGDYKTTGAHRILEIMGKGGKNDGCAQVGFAGAVVNVDAGVAAVSAPSRRHVRSVSRTASVSTASPARTRKPVCCGER